MKGNVSIPMLFITAAFVFSPSRGYSQIALISGGFSLTSLSQSREVNNQTISSKSTTFQFDGSYSKLFNKNIALGIESSYYYTSSDISNFSGFGLGALGYYFLSALKPKLLSLFLFSGAGFSLSDLSEDKNNITFLDLTIGTGGMYPINKNIAIDIRLPFTISTAEVDRTTITNNSFGVKAGFSIFL